MAPDGEPDLVADLYHLDLSEFTTARDALAKQLKGVGDRAGADRVKKLRRPSLTAWALNQAARRHPDLVDAALDAGADLRAATRQAIGGDASALRPAQRAERQTVERIVSAAADRLQGAGHQAADVARRKMAETIRAAQVDEKVAAGLRRGVLDRDHQVTGFALEGGGAGPAADGPAAPTPEAPAPADDQVARQRAKNRAAERSTRARRQADAAERSTRARRQADAAGRLRAAAVQAQRRAAEARQAADEAQCRAAEAECQAADADRRAAEAEDQAAEFEDQAAEAEDQAAETRGQAAAEP